MRLSVAARTVGGRQSGGGVTGGRHGLSTPELVPATGRLAIMNLLLHGLEAPQIAYGNTLERRVNEIGHSERVDVILTNPPFGGKERKEQRLEHVSRTNNPGGNPVDAGVEEVEADADAGEKVAADDFFGYGA